MSTAPQPSALVPKQFEAIMQSVTLTMLGINPNSDPAAYSKVRIGWQQAGQPFTKDPSLDVCVLRSVEEDNFYNRVRERPYFNNPADQAQATDLVQDQYTRVWRVYWVLYGPNSFDNARAIRSGLFANGIHDTLAQLNIYWVTDVSAPLRVPEVSNGLWWERVDFSALFNEFVNEQTTVGTVASVEVDIYPQL